MRVLILTGASCVGKTTLENKLGYPKVQIFTTRKKRANEISDYTFLTESDMADIRSSMDFSFVTNEDTVYGYKFLDNVPIQIVSIISLRGINGLLDVIKKKFNTEPLIVELTASDSEIEQCMKERGFSKETIELRLSILRTESGIKLHRSTAYDYIKHYFEVSSNDIILEYLAKYKDRYKEWAIDGAMHALGKTVAGTFIPKDNEMILRDLSKHVFGFWDKYPEYFKEIVDVNLTELFNDDIDELTTGLNISLGELIIKGYTQMDKDTFNMMSIMVYWLYNKNILILDENKKIKDM